MNKALKRKMMAILEDDLLIKSPTGKRAHDQADINLRQWARGYHNDRREIMNVTGNGGGSALGRSVGRSNDYNPPIDDSRYRALNGIMLRLPKSYQAILRQHYIEFPQKYKERMNSKGKVVKVNISVNEFINTRRFIEAFGKMSRSKYFYLVGDAKQAFIAYGGITL